MTLFNEALCNAETVLTMQPPSDNSSEAIKLASAFITLTQGEGPTLFHRERIAAIYQAIKAEHERVENMTPASPATDQDYEDWIMKRAEARGLFFALRLLHQELGYQ